MRQEGSDVNVSSGPYFLCRLCVVNDRYEPVPVPSDVKDYVAIHMIGILKHSANLVKIVPADPFDDHHPRCDFVRCIRIPFYSLAEVLARNDEHLPNVLHNT